MKFLFKLFVLPIASMLIVPGAFLAMAYKSVEIPYDEFEPSTETVSLTAMIHEEIDGFLADNNPESIISIGLAQKNANQIIALTFREMNPDYALDTAPNDEAKNFVLREEQFAYQGSWVRFKDDIIEIESGVHVFVPNVNFVYKTRVLLAFKLDVSTEEVVLTLDKLMVGNLPLAWMFGPISFAVEQATGTSVSDLVNDQLGGWAKFDVAKREIRLNVDDLLEEQDAVDPQSKALIQMLLEFIKENELVDIGFRDGSFSAEIALGKAKDDTPPYLLPDNLRINNEADFQSILAAKATTLLMSTLTLESGQDPYIEFDALTLNRIFDYFLKDTQVAPGILQQIGVFEKYVLSAYAPYVTIDEYFTINIPITIRSLEEPTHVFSSTIKIKATPSMDGDDLRITLDEIEMGLIYLGGEDINLALSLIGNSEFIQDGAFVIKDFNDQMKQAGLSITDAAVINGKLRLTVELSQTLPIQDIQDIINNVLNGIADNPNYPPELNESINDVLDSIISGDPEEIEAAVAQFISTLEELDDETAEQLLNDLLAELEDQESNFDDLFNLLP